LFKKFDPKTAEMEPQNEKSRIYVKLSLEG